MVDTSDIPETGEEWFKEARLRTPLQLIRVVAPHFVAGFETDGTVRRAAPIIAYMVGWTDERARAYIHRKGWAASVVAC